MNNKFAGSFLLAEDAAPNMLLDFLYAPYRGGYKSKAKENRIYENRKQRIADKVAAEFFDQYVPCTCK